MNLQAAALIGGRSNHTPLSPAGEAAAVARGRELAATGYRPDAVYSTSAIRSEATARLLIEGAAWSLTPQLEDGLLELSQGASEGQPREQWWTSEAQAAVAADPLRHRLAPDGENHEEVQARMRAALQRIAAGHSGGHVLAVGHGIAMRTLVWSLRGGSHADFRALVLPNLAMVSFEVGNDIRLVDPAALIV